MKQIVKMLTSTPHLRQALPSVCLSSMKCEGNIPMSNSAEVIMSLMNTRLLYIGLFLIIFLIL